MPTVLGGIKGLPEKTCWPELLYHTGIGAGMVVPVFTTTGVIGTPIQSVIVVAVLVITGGVGAGLMVKPMVNTFPAARLVQVLGRTFEESITI